MDSNLPFTVEQVKQSLLTWQNEIPLMNILNSEECRNILKACPCFRDRIYTPVITLAMFIKQVLNPDKSCKAAVIRTAIDEFNAGEKEIGTSTGSYCKSRLRLQEESIKELVKETGRLSVEKAPAKWMLYNRPLKVIDGSTVRMPDTKANQDIYPQDNSQKEGLGFPIMRFVVIMSLTTGAILDYAEAAYKGKGTGESSLMRSIMDCIVKDDILVADRYYPSFFLMFDLQRRGADGIFRGQGQRNYDFRKGERLGKNDHIVSWKKPSRPEWMSREEYVAYPSEIRIREFKLSGSLYVTTFLSHKEYRKNDLVEVYKRRWEVEINLRNIKSTMKMDMLSCKSPGMVKKELGVHFIAYNIIRIIMVEACAKHGAEPWKISFKGAVQLINASMPYLIKSSASEHENTYEKMLALMLKNKVGDRPGRIEPRKVKRRPKPYALLTQPRMNERVRLMRVRKQGGLRHVAA